MLLVLINLVFFVQISIASIRHFNPESRSFGNECVRVGSVVGSVVLTIQSVTRLPLPALNSLSSLIAIFGAFAVFQFATSATQGQRLDVVFTNGSPRKLVSGGIYSRVRNPMYSSYLLYWFSWIMASQISWISIFIFVAFAGVYFLAARHEEKVLGTAFRDHYQKYFKETGRFLPRLEKCGPIHLRARLRRWL